MSAIAADDLVLGPWKGPAATEHVRIPIGDGDGDRAFLERVAQLLSTRLP